jgi:hypothetical protein
VSTLLRALGLLLLLLQAPPQGKLYHYNPTTQAICLTTHMYILLLLL